MLFVSQEVFNGFLTVMGTEYFFPNIPLIQPNEDIDFEADQCFPIKITGPVGHRVVVQYPDDIHKNLIFNYSSNVDVLSFLSTPQRDYLIRNDMDCNGNYNQVKVANLIDKESIMVCCFSCPIFSISSSALEIRAVANVCSELYDKFAATFEMVLVFKMTGGFLADESAFRHQLSAFPSSCLAVPFWDSLSSDYICCSLGFAGRGEGILFNACERKVIWHKRLSYFRSYGCDTFPFTNQANQRDFNQRKSSWNDRSLEVLLGNPTVLSKNLGGAGGYETTTIEQLKEKLVGVYLCVDGCFIPKLHEIYECCKAANKAFEVVVVYMPFGITTCNPQLFQTFINRDLEKRKISWWVFPFNNSVSLRLSRLMPTSKDELIVVGKGFVDPHGAYVVQKFGMPAYPFSRKLILEKEMERIRKLTLSSLLVYGDIDYVIRKDSGALKMVPVVSLGGKNIFIFVDFDSGLIDENERGNYPDMKRTLCSFYNREMKARGPEFEVIYVGSFAASVCTSEIPWLVCPYNSHHFRIFTQKIFVKGITNTTLVSINKDGVIGSIKAHNYLSPQGIKGVDQEKQGIKGFPFDGSQLVYEVKVEFERSYSGLELGDIM